VKDGIKRVQVMSRGIILLLTLLLAFVATFFTIAFAWKPIPTTPLRLLIPPLASSGVNVSNTPSDDSRRPAMTISGGNIYVAWREGEGAAAEIYFNKKVSGSWSGNIRVSNDANDSAQPAIAVAGSNVHLVWYDAGLLNIVYKRSNDGGSTWGGSPVNIPDDGEDSFLPAITVSGTVPHVVWGAEPSDLEIFYSNRTGGNWSTSPTNLTASTAGDADHPSIGAGNYLHATWDVDSGTGHFIQYSKSADGGATWSPPVDISGDVTDDGDSTHPDIAVQGSNLFVVWSTLSDETGTSKTYEIRFNKSANDGGTWLTSSAVIATPTISTGFINDFPVPRVAISDTNTIYVVWHEGTSNTDVMSSVSMDGGDSWSPTPDNVSNSSENAQLARVAIMGTTHVVWEEEVGATQYDIFHHYTTGTEEGGGGIYLPIIMKNSS
jgi:hypothetical protein